MKINETIIYRVFQNNSTKLNVVTKFTVVNFDMKSMKSIKSIKFGCQTYYISIIGHKFLL